MIRFAFNIITLKIIVTSIQMVQVVLASMIRDQQQQRGGTGSNM